MPRRPYTRSPFVLPLPDTKLLETYMPTFWRHARALIADRYYRVRGLWMALDPQWGRRGNNQPPDLDEMLRNFQNRLKALFGRGRGERPSGTGGFPKLSGNFGWLAALVIAVWLASGFYIVDASQHGIVLRFGKFVEETLPGPHWHLPYPIETAELVNVTQVRTVEIGYRSSVQNEMPHESLMLTDDANIINIQFAVQYVVKDARNYLFNNRDPDDSVLQAAETAIREIVGKSTMDFVLYEGRSQVTADAQEVMQKILDRYQTGISISKVTMQNAQPPDQVQAAFDDAVKASQDRDRQTNEGEAYANDVIPRAHGTAARLVQEAEGYRQNVIERAQGDASRFRQIVVQYKKAPAVTRERLYLEAIQEILSNTSKVLVDQKGGNNLLYLPLDKLLQMTTPPAASALPAPTPVAPSADAPKPVESGSSDDDAASALARSRDEFLRSRDREER